MSEKVYGYIHDGYTRACFIAERSGLYPALRFSFRPMLTRDRSILSKLVLDAKSPARQEEITAEGVARQVASWDLEDHTGEVVPIDTAHVLRVQPELMRRLYMIAVLGVDGGDEEPDASNGHVEAPQPSLEALLEQGPVILPEDADAGN